VNLSKEVCSIDDDFLYLGLELSRECARRSDILIMPSEPVTVSGQSDIFEVTMCHVLDPTLCRMTLFVTLANNSAQPQLGGTLSLETPENIQPLDDRGILMTESVLRTVPYGRNRVKFDMILTHFAPTFIIGRFSFAIPKADQDGAKSAGAVARNLIKTRTSSSISSADVIHEGPSSSPSPTPRSPPTGMAPPPSPGRPQLRRKMSIIGGRRLNQDQHEFLVSVASESKARSSQDEVFEKADEVLKWPDLFMVPYVVDPFELVLPYPLPIHIFDSQWERYTSNAMFYYEIGNQFRKLSNESFASIKKSLLDRMVQRLNMHEVSRFDWLGGSYFHSSYSFMSWFNDVFAMHLSGYFIPSDGIMTVSVEIRSSASSSLRGFTEIAMQRGFFSGIASSEVSVAPVSAYHGDMIR